MAESLSTRVRFHRSSFCGDCNCVEVAALPGDEIAIRDSKDTRPDAPHLTFTAAEWGAFLGGVMAGEFTRSALVAER
jgi:Domain of unknown function (DUF397)